MIHIEDVNNINELLEYFSKEVIACIEDDIKKGHYEREGWTFHDTFNNMILWDKISHRTYFHFELTFSSGYNHTITLNRRQRTIAGIYRNTDEYASMEINIRHYTREHKLNSILVD